MWDNEKVASRTSRRRLFEIVEPDLKLPSLEGRAEVGAAAGGSSRPQQEVSLRSPTHPSPLPSREGKGPPVAADAGAS